MVVLWYENILLPINSYNIDWKTLWFHILVRPKICIYSNDQKELTFYIMIHFFLCLHSY